MNGANILVDALGWLFILGGSAFVIIGAFGIWRFPDFWSRLHAASITDSAGVILLIAGMVLHGGISFVSAKLLIIGVFLFITGPTATHAIANAALVTGLRPTEGKGLTGAEPSEIASDDASAKDIPRD